VLLEIAYWNTIDKILDIDLETAGQKETWSVKRRLLTEEKQHLDHVKSYLGNTVEGVIRACLVGREAFDLPQGCAGSVAGAFHSAFGAKVEGVGIHKGSVGLSISQL
jgi:hypothetical protein